MHNTINVTDKQMFAYILLLVLEYSFSYRPPVREHLCEDAADGPDVDGLGVALRVQHDLRRPVPSVHTHHLSYY